MVKIVVSGKKEAIPKKPGWSIYRTRSFLLFSPFMVLFRSLNADTTYILTTGILGTFSDINLN